MKYSVPVCNDSEGLQRGTTLIGWEDCCTFDIGNMLIRKGSMFGGWYLVEGMKSKRRVTLSGTAAGVGFDVEECSSVEMRGPTYLTIPTFLWSAQPLNMVVKPL